MRYEEGVRAYEEAIHAADQRKAELDAEEEYDASHIAQAIRAMPEHLRRKQAEYEYRVGAQRLIAIWAHLKTPIIK